MLTPATFHRLGKYDLIRQIAVGGMAELYLGRTLGLEGFEKLVVLKRILPQYRENERFVSMFLNEARLAATLQHPNIAQVYDIGQEQGEYFFAMEYVHGEDLGRVIDSAAEHGVGVPLDAALTLVAGLCAGLNYAHAKAGPDGRPLNIVHRDVSPSNVLVSYDGAVKLVDFGIARAGSAPSTRGGIKGKVSYMSPEQCRGGGLVDRRSDLYAVGTILYELTTGRLPFAGDSEYGILNQIVNLDVPRPTSIVPSYPPALEAIVMRALARDPAQRYSTALELQSHIEDFAHDNRLRISPLVLARVMSSLFPQRLEEWDHARAQGAFFVEQHVLRTLAESGKTPAAAPASHASGEHDDTSVSPPVSTIVGPPPVGAAAFGITGARPSQPHMVAPQRPSAPHVPTPTPTPAVGPTTATPLPRAPQWTPIPPGATYDVRQPTPSPGIAAVPAPTPNPMRIITPPPQASPVRIPTAPPPAAMGGDGETSLVVIGTRSKKPWIVLALAGAVGSAVAAAIVLSGNHSAPATSAGSAAVARTEDNAAPPDAREPTIASVVEPREPSPPAIAEPVRDASVIVEPVSEPVVAKPAPTRLRSTAKSSVRKKPIAKKPATRPRPRPTSKKKDPTWSDDSPFLPVRPDGT